MLTNGMNKLIKKLKKIIITILPSRLVKILIDILIDIHVFYALGKNRLSIKKHKMFFDVKDRSGRCIRISHKHNIYLLDIINSFQYYFKAVKPIEIDGIRLIDYSTPRYHEVNGYDIHPIIFPSFAEPISTTEQYLKFAKLKNNSIVLDLGAYSGLTSILFDQAISNNGQVIAVDADRVNIKYIKKNLALYKKMTGRDIRLLEGAVWENNRGVMFSNEGNMGSSVASIIGQQRGTIIKTSSFTLSTIARKYHLKKIDFIKCDIEGAESVIFKDRKFFDKNRPKIIIEPHIIDNVSTIQSCIDQLSIYGYKFKKINQNGVNLPLLECLPLE